MNCACILMLLCLTLFSAKPKPKIVFKSPKSLVVGDSITMHWHVENVRNAVLSIEDIADDLPYTGSLCVAPKESRRYNLLLHDKKGLVKKKYVYVEVRKPEIMLFAVYQSNGQRIFQWRVRNAKKIYIPGVTQCNDSTGILVTDMDSIDTFRLIAQSDTCTDMQYAQVQEALSRPYIFFSRQANQLSQEEVLRMDIFEINRKTTVERIMFRVAVTDNYGAFISGLAPPYGKKDSVYCYFKAVTENYEKSLDPVRFDVREIRQAQSDNADVVFALDYSGTMAPVIDQIERALMQFISRKAKDDRIAVYRFDEHIEKSCPLQRDPMKIASMLNMQGIRGFGGACALFAAIDESCKEFTPGQKNRKYLIVVTQGRDNASLSHYLTNSTEPDAITAKLQKLSITPVFIVFGNNSGTGILQWIAAKCNGLYYSFGEEQDPADILTDIQYLMKNYYEVSYMPLRKEGNRNIGLLYNKGADVNVYTSASLFHYDSTGLDQSATDMLMADYDSMLAVMGLVPLLPPQVVLTFMLDSVSIEPRYRADLNNYLAYIKKHDEAIIVLAGHTDLSGKEKYNYALSQRRALQVKEYFIKAGIAEDRLQIVGFGPSLSLWNPEVHEWMARENRRVEALFCKQKMDK